MAWVTWVNWVNWVAWGPWGVVERDRVEKDQEKNRTFLVQARMLEWCVSGAG